MLRNLRIVRAGFLGTCVLVAGCATSLEHLKIREPETNMPPDYGLVAPPAPLVPQPVDPTAPPPAVVPPPPVPAPAPAPEAPKFAETLDWKDFFKDEPLAGLIETGLSKNRELAVLEQEIAVSKNEILAREGEYLPKLGLKAGAGIDRVGRYTSQGQSDEALGLQKDLPDLSLGLAASWELDIWNKLRSATKAALQRYLATIDGRNFVVTRLVAEIAKGYYELRALHKKVEILDQNIELQRQALESMRLQKKAARVTELAVKRFEAEVAKNQSRKYIFAQEIIEKENELNFLAGRFPQHIEFEPADFIATVPKAIQAGIPSQLLDNRPDVRQASLELKAAKLSVDSARARFYPALSIEAGGGFRAFNTQHLFTTPDSMVYNLAANLSAPLLNRNAIAADYLSAGSKQLQAVYNFEKAILHAYTEVSNQLNKVENLRNTFQLKSEQVEALVNSIEISNTLFRAARCDYVEVLLTRRDALEAQMELVEVKQQQLSAVVSLYQALGGGWTRPKPATN